MPIQSRISAGPGSRSEKSGICAAATVPVLVVVLLALVLAFVPLAAGIVFGEAALYASACRLFRREATPRWMKSSKGDVSPILLAWLWIASFFGFCIYPAQPIVVGHLLGENLLAGFVATLMSTATVASGCFVWICFRMSAKDMRKHRIVPGLLGDDAIPHD